MVEIDSVIIRGMNHKITYHDKLSKGDLEEYRYEEGDKPEDGIWGAANPSNLVIKISNDVAEPMKLITLWHEIIHFVLCHGSIMMGSQDEHQVDILAYGLVELIRNNPDLIKLTLKPQEE